MDQRRSPEYNLEVFADPQSAKEVVKGKHVPFSPQQELTSSPGVLQTIFFHRFFPSIRPSTLEVLDLSLPVVNDVELDTLIEQKATMLMRQLDTTSDMGVRSSGTGVRGQVVVQFFEKKRRRTWFAKGEDVVCWEQWTLDVTLASPRTENGEFACA